MLPKLAPLRVATPVVVSVVAVPTGVPFNLKLTVFPPTGLPLPVRVAVSVTVPPYAPVALATLSDVAWRDVIEYDPSVGFALSAAVVRETGYDPRAAGFVVTALVEPITTVTSTPAPIETGVVIVTSLLPPPVVAVV